MFYSVVVPTHARINEVAELLSSLESQQNSNFEVIIADNSMDDSVKEVVESFSNKLKIKYLYHKGLGVSASRNWGAEHAEGDYVIFFDSDCVVPSHYFTAMDNFLKDNPLDAFGGPDKAGDNFNTLQRAISYAMTSFFTTGGIRGDKKHIGQYQPRSFNMGIRKNIFDKLGGFSGMAISEDIDLSMRLYNSGFRVGLIEDAYVYHKRRSTYNKFFKRIFAFGGGRVNLRKKHRNALKIVHLLPLFFVLYLIAGLLSVLISIRLFGIWWIPLAAYLLLIIGDAAVKTRSIFTGIMSGYASVLMLIAYGTGMLKAIFFNNRSIKKK